MRKAITLEIRLHIEADDEPAHDFAASTIAAVKEIIAAGAKSRPGLELAVKRVREIHT